MAELTPIFEQMPSEVLIRFADQHNMITTNLKDCLYAESGNQGYALNYLSAGLKPMVAEQEKLKPWAGIQGTALFRHHKLVATLPMKESLAVSWAVNEVKGPLYTVSWKEEKASVFIITSSSKKSVRMVSGHPVFTVKLYGTGDVIYKQKQKRLDTLQVKELIERELNDQIAGHLRKALRTSQQTGADILRLGMLVDWNYPDHWHEVSANWPDYYKMKLRFRWLPTSKFETSGQCLK